MGHTTLQYLGYHFMTSEQVRAARMLIRWEQKDLAERAGVSLPSIKRLETQPGPLKAHAGTIRALQAAFEDAGVEFIAEGETSASAGAGVRLKAGA